MSPPKKASLFVIFLAVFIDLLGFGMVLPLLPLYAKEFAAVLNIDVDSPRMGLLLGTLMASFSAMQFLFAPLWGRLSDRIGRRPVLLIGLGGSAIFYALFGLATVWKSIVWLFIARIGAGIAGATISTAHAYIADVTTKETRAKGMALVGAAFGLGFTFGPLLGYFALEGDAAVPGPGPGYAAAALSASAFLLAYFKLGESLRPDHAAHSKRGWLNLSALGDALATPSIAALLLTSFLCVFAFANFESTLSLLVKDEHGAFRYTYREVLLIFAFVGFVLTLAQGGLVRRLSGRLSEGTMATIGAIAEVAGFIWLATSLASPSLTTLLAALSVIVVGFAFITPSLNALISRRSDPAKQGGILGLAQSVSSLARILGPMAGLPLYTSPELASRYSVTRGSTPFWVAAGLMCAGAILITIATRSGKDYEARA
jgi:DHA1 family tetracycline resistance protein-like MFS transporter